MNYCAILRCDGDYYCTPISDIEAASIRRGVGSRAYSGMDAIIDRVIRTSVYSSAAEHVRANIKVVAVLDQTQTILIEHGLPRHEVSGSGSGTGTGTGTDRLEETKLTCPTCGGVLLCLRHPE